jgi:membrane protease YdiL (CAAX protease family)
MKYTPEGLNSGQILQAMGIENAIFFMALALGYLLGVDVFSSFAFSLDNVVLGTYFGLIVSAVGAMLDRSSIKFFREVSRDSQAFSLFLLGRNTAFLKASLVAFLFSLSAGFAEEILFRGVLFQAVEQAFGLPLALLVSSIGFGLAHFPIFSANMLLEASIGLAFGIGYWYSGKNIVIPIAMHTVYDLVTILSSWYVGMRALKHFINDEEARMLDLTSSAATPFDVQAKAVFDFLDINKDGLLAPNEVDIGLRILRFRRSNSIKIYLIELSL